MHAIFYLVSEWTHAIHQERKSLINSNIYKKSSLNDTVLCEDNRHKYVDGERQDVLDAVAYLIGRLYFVVQAKCSVFNLFRVALWDMFNEKKIIVW